MLYLFHMSVARYRLSLQIAWIPPAADVTTGAAEATVEMPEGASFNIAVEVVEGPMAFATLSKFAALAARVDVEEAPLTAAAFAVFVVLAGFEVEAGEAACLARRWVGSTMSSGSAREWTLVTNTRGRVIKVLRRWVCMTVAKRS